MAKNRTSVESALASRVSRTDPCPDTALGCAPAAHSSVRPLAICTANAASLSPGGNDGKRCLVARLALAAQGNAELVAR